MIKYSLFFLSIILLMCGIYADTNGVWHEAEDVVPGTFGADQNSSDFSFSSNVGIKTNSPSTELDIVGNINVSSIFDRENNAFYINPNSISTFNDLRPSIIKDRDNPSFYVDPYGNSWLARIYSYDIRADIFKDRNDPSFYVDLANTSQINRINANKLYAYDWIQTLGPSYVGGNGKGDSKSYFYDDNSDAWRSIYWDDSHDRFRIGGNTQIEGDLYVNQVGKWLSNLGTAAWKNENLLNVDKVDGWDKEDIISYIESNAGGKVKVDFTGACNNANLGLINFDTSKDKLFFCDSNDWREIYMAKKEILNINSNTNNYNISQHLSLMGPTEIQVNIASGVKIGSTSASSPAFTTGDLPSGSKVTIINNGKIGGAGGKGGKFGSPVGEDGGDAIELTVDTTIDNRGKIWGGGGGGSSSNCNHGYFQDGAGGGGAGLNPGAGGAGHSHNYGNGWGGWYGGQPGTETSGGAGGASSGTGCSYGGDGGDPGQSGNYGARTGQGAGIGAAGSSVRKNGNSLTWISTGDRRGPVRN